MADVDVLAWLLTVVRFFCSFLLLRLPRLACLTGVQRAVSLLESAELMHYHALLILLMWLVVERVWREDRVVMAARGCRRPLSYLISEARGVGFKAIDVDAVLLRELLLTCKLREVVLEGAHVVVSVAGLVHGRDLLHSSILRCSLK